MTTHYEPMLAKSADRPFNSEDWIFEIKWDGIRAISYVCNDLSIRSRNGKELKFNFPELEELRGLTRNSIVDGEIVVMKEGKADFQSLAQRSRTVSVQEIKYMSGQSPATYIIFDILEKDRRPLINLTLIERKKLLRKYVNEGHHVILSDFVEKEGEAYYNAAIAKDVEGIMAKKKDSQYEPGVRSAKWLKIKRTLTCDCVVFGYTIGQGTRRATFGAMILGLFGNQGPVYVGKVGTGFSQKEAEGLLKTFESLHSERKTLEGVNVREEIIWLKPKIVCEVSYQSLTTDEHLRMPRFRGIRSDKHPSECTMDQVKNEILREYYAKRDFDITPEPKAAIPEEKGRHFVVQEHHARRLHYDLRLQKNGVLKSWAVPKGIPRQPGEKRLAVETEDHPLEYRLFEGIIPKGEYGAGTVTIFDNGTYKPKIWTENMIEFTLNGRKLEGKYVLTRFKKAGEKQWLLLKTNKQESEKCI